MPLMNLCLETKRTEDFGNVIVKPRFKFWNSKTILSPLLRVDSGSTTIKAVLIDADKNIRYSKYLPNEGQPLNIFKEILQEIYQINPAAKIMGTCSTGYGEDLIKNALVLDAGLVETMAHFETAGILIQVDFIIDIGEDIKCLKSKMGSLLTF